jgi:hypothetical protein
VYCILGDGAAYPQSHVLTRRDECEDRNTGEKRERDRDRLRRRERN